MEDGDKKPEMEGGKTMEDGDKKPEMEDGVKKPEMEDVKLTEMTIDKYLDLKRPPLLLGECKKQIEGLSTLITDVMSNDEETQLQASHMIGNILRMNCLFGLDIPWQQLTEMALLNRLVLFLLQKDLPQLQYESVTIISMVAEDSKNILALVSNGVVPALVQLLNSSIEITRALAVRALGNIAKKSKHYCQLIIQNEALEALLPGFSTHMNRQNASWMLRLFCNLKPKLKSDTVKQVLVVLEHNLYSSNEVILVDTCWTIASLSDVAESMNQVATNLRICYKLIELLVHKSHFIVEPVLKTVANIVTRCQMDIKVIQPLLDKGLLRRLLSILLSKDDNNTNKNICMIISTITNISSNHAEDVVCYGFIYVLADLFETLDNDLKMEVVNVILRVTLTGTTETTRLVGGKSIKILCSMLDAGSSNFSEMCLRGIKCVWAAWEPEKRVALWINIWNDFEKIKMLRHHKEVKISLLAEGILNDFTNLKLTEQQREEMLRLYESQVNPTTNGGDV